MPKIYREEGSHRLLALLGGLSSLDLFGATELERERLKGWRDSWRWVKRTFLARFLRSFLNLREAFSTLVASPDCVECEISCWVNRIHQTKGTHSDETVSGFELLLGSLIIVDQSKSSAPSSTKLCSETEGHDAGLVGFVKSSQLLGEVGSRDIGAAGVEDVDNELTTREESVGDEFACAQSNGC